MKNDCLFCAIIDGEIPSNKVYEDELCYAFYDIEPQAPTHFLVVPKAHICCANDIDESNEAVVAHCFTVIAKLCKELGCESYRIVNNCGDQAGQTVKHLHFHVLSSIGATVFRTEQVAVAQGQLGLMSEGQLALTYVDEPDKLIAGDLVVTSGLGGYYPSGLPIGTVTELRTDTGGLTQYAVLSPKADIGALTQVFLITEFDVVE